MEAFFQILNTETTDGMVQTLIQVNPEHPIYKGHFPGHPITPGAMLVRMAIEIVAGQCGLGNDAHEVKNVKFLHPHFPQEQKYLTFSFRQEQSQVEVTIRQEEVTYAKMTLLF